jgi:hypothetical protein
MALNGAGDHHFFDFSNGLGGIEALGAHVHAIHDGVATEEAVRVF